MNDEFEFELLDECDELKKRGKYVEYFKAFIESPNKILKMNCVSNAGAIRAANAARYYKSHHNYDYCIVVKRQYLYLVKA